MPEQVAATDLRGLRVFVSYPRGGLAHTWAERVQCELIACGAEARRDETGVGEGDGTRHTAAATQRPHSLQLR